MLLTFMFESTLRAYDKIDEPFIFGAVGDSITAGVNSTGWGSQLQDSWATGHNFEGIVNSHYMKLKKIMSKRIKTVNVARGGASANSINDQLDELEGYKPDYITLLIGSNDVCQWGDHYESKLENYKKNINSALQRMIKMNSQVKILLLPVPDLFMLWEIGNQNNCQWVWDMTGFCKNLLSSHRTKDQRLSFKDKVSRVNQILNDLSHVYSNHVKFDYDLQNFKYTRNHLSRRDCFHPSGFGQNLIAQHSWDLGWFADYD